MNNTNVVSATETASCCGVCGDRARCRHYGGVACNGCKAFFRRAIQSGSHKTFICENGQGKCSVSRSTRRKCQLCRFVKCRRNGMEPKWVMGETERLALKLSKIAQNAHKTELSMISIMYLQETDLAARIVQKYQDAVIHISVKRRTALATPDIEQEVADMFLCGMLRMTYFVSQISEFLHLQQTDADTIIRESLLPIYLIRLAFSADVENASWPRKHVIESYHVHPPRKLSMFRDTVSVKLGAKFHEFGRKLTNELKSDEQCVMFLVLVVLFRPDVGGIIDQSHVDHIHNRVLCMLRNYLFWSRGDHDAAKLFPKLLHLLADLREIEELHDEINFELSERQDKMLRENLGRLYPFKKISIRHSPLDDLDDILEVLEKHSQQTKYKYSADLYEVIDNMDTTTVSLNELSNDDDVEKWMNEITI